MNMFKKISIIFTLVVLIFFSYKFFIKYEKSQILESKDPIKIISLLENEDNLNTEEIFLLSNAYRDIGETEKSLVQLNLFLNKTQDVQEQAKGFINKGILELNERDFISAKKSFITATNLTSSGSELNFISKKLYVSLVVQNPNENDAKIAIKFLSEIIKKERTAINLHQMGTLFFYFKDYEYAENFWIEAIELDHTYYVIYNSLGFLYIDKLELEKANKMFDKTISYNPDNYEAYFGKAYSMQLLNKDTDAKFYYTKAIDLNKLDVKSRYSLATLYLKEGSKKKASELLFTITKINPQSIYAKEAQNILNEILPKIILPIERLNGVNNNSNEK